MPDTLPPLPSLQTPPEPPAAPTVAHPVMQISGDDTHVVQRIPSTLYKDLLRVAIAARSTVENVIILACNDLVTVAKARAARKVRTP